VELLAGAPAPDAGAVAAAGAGPLLLAAVLCGAEAARAASARHLARSSKAVVTLYSSGERADWDERALLWNI
jgi:hypothetical protein